MNSPQQWIFSHLSSSPPITTLHPSPSRHHLAMLFQYQMTFVGPTGKASCPAFVSPPTDDANRRSTALWGPQCVFPPHFRHWLTDSTASQPTTSSCMASIHPSTSLPQPCHHVTTGAQCMLSRPTNYHSFRKPSTHSPTWLSSQTVTTPYQLVANSQPSCKQHQSGVHHLPPFRFIPHTHTRIIQPDGSLTVTHIDSHPMPTTNPLPHPSCKQRQSQASHLPQSSRLVSNTFHSSTDSAEFLEFQRIPAGIDRNLTGIDRDYLYLGYILHFYFKQMFCNWGIDQNSIIFKLFY